MSGRGFRVDTARMRHASARFADSGESLDAVRRGIALPEVPVRAFGPAGHDIAAAVSQSVEQRVISLTARIDSLGNLAGRISASADDYDRMDADAADDLRYPQPLSRKIGRAHV